MRNNSNFAIEASLCVWLGLVGDVGRAMEGLLHISRLRERVRSVHDAAYEGGGSWGVESAAVDREQYTSRRSSFGEVEVVLNCLWKAIVGSPLGVTGRGSRSDRLRRLST